jgi:hypothetical protein
MGWNGIGWLIALGLSALGTAVTYLWPGAREFGYFLLGIGAIAFLLATLGAIRCGWPYLKALRVRLGAARTMLLVGILGTWIFLTLTLGIVAWTVVQPTMSAPATVAADDGPISWFTNLEMQGGPALNAPVAALVFHGANRSQKEVALKRASIVSAINGRKIDLEIAAKDAAGKNDLVSIDKINLVPPGSPVDLYAKFGEADPSAPGKVLGLDLKTFLETWSKFYFIVEDDSRTYRIPYNEGNMMVFFPGMVGPHVTMK